MVNMRLRKDNKKNKDTVTIRMDETERNKAQQKADLYCEGNLSEWIRYASINCVPKKKDLTDVNE